MRKADGTKEESRLFKDLVTLIGDRTQAIKIYTKTKSDKFIARMNDRLKPDELGEYTIGSLFKETSLLWETFSDSFPMRLARRSNLDKPLPNTKENIDKLADRANEFNQKGEFDDFIATVTMTDDGKVTGQVSRRTPENMRQAKNMLVSKSLNDKLRTILQEHGVSIGVLEEAEAHMSNGVTDFSAMERMANGMVEMIRLANGERGEQALPEEFSHVILEMMSGDPLRERLIGMLRSDRTLLREILGSEYGRYERLYDGDIDRLVREAAGKLLAKHLINQEHLDESKPYTSLLQRFINAIKDFFRKFTMSDIEKAVNEANAVAAALGRDILAGTRNDAIALKNIQRADRLFQTVLQDVTEESDLIKELAEAAKQYKTQMGSRSRSVWAPKKILGLYERDQTNFGANTLQAISDILGILSWEGKRIVGDMKTALTDKDILLKQKFATLRDAKTFVVNFEGIIGDIQNFMTLNSDSTDPATKKKIMANVHKLRIATATLLDAYDRHVMPQFAYFIKPYMTDSFMEFLRKKYGKELSDDELTQRLLSVSSDDIGFFDRWFDAAADSSDDMIRLIDTIHQQLRFNIREKSVEDSKTIIALGKKLRDAGVRGFEWMFEKRADGKKTGDYIHKYDHRRYDDDKQTEMRRLQKQYDITTDEGERLYAEAMNRWHREHSKVQDSTVMPGDQYLTSEYSILNEAQKSFYDEIMKIKGRLDAMLPTRYTYLENAVKIHKDLIERLFGGNSTMSIFSKLHETLKEQYIQRSDDTEFGIGATDSDGNAIQMLPVYYTKMREGETADDMSTDVVSTMIAYADMCNNFNGMNEVIDVLEAGREIANNRNISPTMASPLRSRLRNLTLNRQENPRARRRLDDYFDMQIYGRYMKEQTVKMPITGTTLSLNKIVNSLLNISSLNMFALNINSAISNVSTGNVMMLIEAAAKRYFSISDMAAADRHYFAALPDYITEIGTPLKNSKLALWMEYFNVLQDNEKVMRDVQWDKLSARRILNNETLYILNTLGEHWMQTRTSLALANSFKMRSKSGEVVSLWDAVEVVPIDGNNPQSGSRLQIKEGYTKLDGTAFSLDDKYAFTQKSKTINQHMHGIYNMLDRSAVQSMAYGPLLLLFRKWMMPSFNKRFGGLIYSFDLQDQTQGYYSTLAHYIADSIIKPIIKKESISILATYGQLEDYQKANIARALTEISSLIIISLIAGMAKNPDWGNSWAARQLRYQSRRLYSEIAAMTPSPIMFKEAIRIISNPSAAMRPFEHLINLTQLANTNEWTTNVKYGRYKGHSRAYRLFMESPLMPMYGTIQRGLHPEDVMQSILSSTQNY